MEKPRRCLLERTLGCVRDAIIMQTEELLFKLAFNYARLNHRKRVYLFTSDYSRRNQTVATAFILCSSVLMKVCAFKG